MWKTNGYIIHLPFCMHATPAMLMDDIHSYQVMNIPQNVSICFKFPGFCWFVSVIKLFKCTFPLLNKKVITMQLLSLSVPQHLLLCGWFVLFTFWKTFVSWHPIGFSNSYLILLLLKSDERLRKIYNCPRCLHKPYILWFIRTLIN